MNNANPGLLLAANEIRLAGRWNRLGASLIDGLIHAAIVFPIQYATGFWQLVIDTVRMHEHLPFSAFLPWILLGFVVFVLVQGYPLVKDGQTWGKKALSIKIVDMDGRKPFVPQLFARYAVYLFAGAIPRIGPLASLVNICLIFRSDRRCGHDLVAGTRVVEVIQS